jgi:aminoglycoside 6'-N-acetyltransferase
VYVSHGSRSRRVELTLLSWIQTLAIQSLSAGRDQHRRVEAVGSAHANADSVADATIRSRCTDMEVRLSRARGRATAGLVGPTGVTLIRVIELRPLVADDLPFVAGWLRQPHVARWWLAGTTAEAELDEVAARVAESASSATRLLAILERSRHDLETPVCIGWCQWYAYDAYPAEADAIGARAGDCGIDYAIGDPAAIGRGLGTELIAALVGEVRRYHPGCGVIADPDATNRLPGGSSSATAFR